MTLKLRSQFQGITSAGGGDWDDVFDSVPMLKSETADGAAAVAAYIDTTTNWANAAARLYSFRNNGVEKAYVDRGGKVVASSFDGNGSALTALAAANVATGTLSVARGGTGVDASAAANGKVLIGNGTGFALATLTAGTNVTITNGAGTISIASAAAGSVPAGSSGDYQYNSAGAYAGGSIKEIASGMVGLGGSTSSYPGLKRSSAILQVRLADDSAYASLQVGTLLIQGNVIVTQQGSGHIRLGDDDAASPVSQILGVQGARGGTDSNTAGGSLTIQSGIGTGGSTPSSVNFKVPGVAASGTTAQTLLTALTVQYTTVCAFVKLQTQLGTIADQTYAYYASATWNDGAEIFELFRCDVTDTASDSTSLILNYRVGGTSQMTLGKGGTLSVATAYQVAAVQVVGARDTGWTAMAGTPDKASAYNTATVTLPQLAGRVMALQTALTAHGLLGA